MPSRARCLYCRCLFYPDPHCKHPKACKKPACQKKRRNKSHKIWRDKDPEVLEDRRATSREWMRDHPGYMQEYRAKHLAYVERNRRRQRERGLAKGVVKSISISPQLFERYRELIQPLSVVKSTSIANCPSPGLQGAP